MTKHRWHLEVTKKAQEHIDDLPPDERRSVFLAMRRILTAADHPINDSKVKKLRDKKLPGQYRIRQGNYRIFFDVDPTEITHLKTKYKGTVVFRAVRNRKDAYKDS